MTATPIDGKAIAADIRADLAVRVAALKTGLAEGVSPPGLAVVLVGQRKDSATYVRSKKKACEEAGIASFGVELDEAVTQEALEAEVERLNGREDVHGILVQLPLPGHIDEEKVLEKIRIEKDVDGFHPENIGRLCMKGRTPPFAIPCTPKGCIELIERSGVTLDGKRAVVLGRSNIVGLPASLLLTHRNATVTVCHSRTIDLPSIVREADIIIAAIGRANFVKKEWVKPGAVVIDVGINAVDDPTSKKGYKLVGDVDYDGVSEVASMITPVPGGVGPMTIAMLMVNTVEAAERYYASLK